MSTHLRTTLCIAALATLVGGCTSTKNFMYSLGEKMPTYGDSECDGSFFCSGNDAQPNQPQPTAQQQSQRQFTPRYQPPAANTARRPLAGNIAASQQQPAPYGSAQPPAVNAPTPPRDPYAHLIPAPRPNSQPLAPANPRYAIPQNRAPLPTAAPTRPSVPLSPVQKAWTPPSNFDPAGIKNTNEYREVEQDLRRDVPPSPYAAPAPVASTNTNSAPSADAIFNEIRQQQGLAPLPSTTAQAPAAATPNIPGLPNVPAVFEGYQPPAEAEDLPESPYNEIIRSINELPE